MILKPEILTHPNIPKPLHGMNPRSILGSAWWDIERQKAYASTDYHCIACGVHKSQAKVHQWLEAHEYWDINYKTGRCEVKSIEPLCHYCHNFIHSGRLFKTKTTIEVREILEHGFNVLSRTGLKVFFFTHELARLVRANTFGVKYYTPTGRATWSDFVLILDGKEYKSKFKSMDEWEQFYKD